MAIVYTELIDRLRDAADMERGVLALEGMGTESEHVKLLCAAAAAIETLSNGIEAYAKANAELTAWKENAQEWMQKVAEEKSAADREAEPVPDPTPAPALEVYYICDRRACDDCNDECMLTCDPRHAKHFEIEDGALCERLHGGFLPYIPTHNGNTGKREAKEAAK